MFQSVSSLQELVIIGDCDLTEVRVVARIRKYVLNLFLSIFMMMVMTELVYSDVFKMLLGLFYGRMALCKASKS